MNKTDCKHVSGLDQYKPILPLDTVNKSNAIVLRIDDHVQDRESPVLLQYLAQQREETNEVTDMRNYEKPGRGKATKLMAPLPLSGGAQCLLPGNVAATRPIPQWLKSHIAVDEQIAGQDAIGINLYSLDGVLTWWRQDGGCKSEKLSGRFVWFVPAGVRHRCEWNHGGDCLILVLAPGFARQVIGGKLDEVVLREASALEREDPFIWQLSRELRRICRSNEEPDRFYLNSICGLIAVHILRAHAGSNVRRLAQASGLLPGTLNTVTQYIHDHLRSRLDLKSLAKRAHLGPRQFGRLFKISTGFSPQQYVLRARVHRAHEILITTRCRVADAAYEAGFYDQSHLDRYFRRMLGFPPSALLRDRADDESVAQPA